MLVLVGAFALLGTASLGTASASPRAGLPATPYTEQVGSVSTPNPGGGANAVDPGTPSGGSTSGGSTGTAGMTAYTGAAVLSLSGIGVLLLIGGGVLLYTGRRRADASRAVLPPRSCCTSRSSGR